MEKHSPLERKRFVLPTEEVARERLGKIKEVYRELKQQHPEIISMTLFGSYTKGRATEKSDIDAWVFIDEEKAKANYGWGLPNEKLREQEKYWRERWRKVLKDEEALPEEVRKIVTIVYFRNLLKQAFAEGLSVPVPKVRDLRPILLSEEILDRGLEVVKESLTEEDPFPSFADFAPPLALPLIAMFYLSIDNDIVPYRKYLLEKLHSMGREGEKIWKGIAYTLKGWERETVGLPVGRGLYPQTIEEAMKRFT